jgi:ABC-2 type transport system permease protein
MRRRRCPARLAQDGNAMTVLAIARARAHRIVRDRIALFFLIVLPVLVIVLVGAVVGGTGHFRVGYVDEDRSPLASSLIDDLRAQPAFTLHAYASVAAGKTALRRNEIEGLVEILPGTAERLRAGHEVSIPVYGEPTNSDQQAAGTAISSVIATHGGRIQAARFAQNQAGGSFDGQLATARRVAASLPSVDVATRNVDNQSRILPAGFDYSAPTMLVLFVFINAFAGGAAMIMTRELGMYDRMTAAPVSPRQIVFGETAVYFSIALVQSLLIVTVGTVVFGVHWGNALAASVLIVTWALVGTGAGMLSGTVFKTREQAVAIGPPVGIVLGMLGGCMWPLEIVGSTMRTIGHVVPQAWAVDAWTELISRGGGITEIGRELLVLLAFAVALLAIASARLRRTLTR